MPSVDERIVSMQFDNRKFEHGVSTTIRSLKKLKDSLNLEASAKSLNRLQYAGDHFDFGGVSKGIAGLTSKLTGMGLFGTTALQKIASSAINAGTIVTKALTIDPIKTGFREYELKMNSVQTIMASTGKTIDVVNGYLNELNEYSDRTIYSFQDMTSNIGKFTNAGVSLEDAVMAIKGISNEAAVSGANANEASRAMYNFSQALSAGYVKLIDWKSIENANMATKEFKQQLIDTAVALGTLKEEDGMYITTTTDMNGKISDAFNSTKNFNEALSHQWMTSEVLVETLKKYADETTDIGKKAYAAAQDVKTFTQLYDTLKEAAQSGWAQSWEIIIGDLEEAKKLLTGISNVVGGMIGNAADRRNTLLSGWDELGGRFALIEAGKNSFEALRRAMLPIKSAFRDIFPQMTADRLYAMTENLKEFTESLKMNFPQAMKIRRIAKGAASALDILKRLIVEIFKAASPIFGLVGKLVGVLVDYMARLGDMITKLRDYIVANDTFANVIKKVWGKVLPVIERITEAAELMAEKITGIFKKMSENSKKVPNIFSKSGLNQLIEDAKDRIAHFGRVSDEVGPKLSELAEKIASLGGKSSKFMELIGKVTAKSFELMGEAVEWGSEKLLEYGASLDISIESIATALGNFISGEWLERLMDLANSGIFTAILLGLKKMVKYMTEGAKNIKNVGGNVNKYLDSIKKTMDELGNVLKSFTGKINAQTLITLAKAIGILALALIGLSMVNPAKLMYALDAISVLMVEMLGAMVIFQRMNDLWSVTSIGEFKRSMMAMGKMAVGMGAIARAIATLSFAMMLLSTLDWNELAIGLVGIGVLLAEIGVFMTLVDAKNNKFNTKGLIKISVAIMILSAAVHNFGEMDFGQLVQGISAITVLMAVMGGFAALTKNTKHMISIGIGMNLIAASLFLFANALQHLGSMDVGTVVLALEEMGAILAALTIVSLSKPSGFIRIAVALTVLGLAIRIIAYSIGELAKESPEKVMPALVALISMLGAMALVIGYIGNSMNPKTFTKIATGMLGLAISIGVVSVFMKKLADVHPNQLLAIITSLIVLMGAVALISESLGNKKALMGSAALDAAIDSMAILAGSMSVLAQVPMKKVASGLLLLGGSIAILGGAGMILGNFLPGMAGLIGLSVSFIGVGVGLMGLGAGMLLFASALGILAVSGVAGVTALMTIVKVIAKNIPLVASTLVEGIVAIAQLIADSAVTIAQAVTTVIFAIVNAIAVNSDVLINGGMAILLNLLTGIATNIGKITELGFLIIINLCDAITAGLPQLIDRGVKLIIAFVNGVANAIRDNAEPIYNAMGNLVSSLIELMITGLQMLLSKIPGIGEKIDAGLEKAKTSIRNALTTEEMTKTGSGAVDAVAEGASQNGSAASGAGEDTGKSFIDGLQSAFNSDDGIAATMTESFSPESLNIPGITDTLGTELTNGLGGLSSSIKGSGREASGNYSTGIKLGKAKASMAGGELAGAGVSGSRSKNTEFHQAGLDTANGFAKGMEDGVDTVSGAAAAMAQAAIDAAKRILDSNSPSKVFMTIGDDSDNGMAIGLTRSASIVANSAEEVGMAAINSVRNTIQKFSSTIADNIDPNPTIRPVLDLSDVRNGSRILGAMLSDTNRLSISTSRDQAASIAFNRKEKGPSEYGSSDQSENGKGSVTYIQNNYSPKSLSRIDIYRQTKNQISQISTVKGVVKRV